MDVAQLERLGGWIHLELGRSHVLIDEIACIEECWVHACTFVDLLVTVMGLQELRSVLRLQLTQHWGLEQAEEK